MGYDSDLESDDETVVGLDENTIDGAGSRVCENKSDECKELPTKRTRRQLNEPVLITWLKLHGKQSNEWKQALQDIEKLLWSHKTKFQAGNKGLQSY